MTMMEVKWWLWKQNSDDGGEMKRNNDRRGEMVMMEAKWWNAIMEME